MVKKVKKGFVGGEEEYKHEESMIKRREKWVRSPNIFGEFEKGASRLPTPKMATKKTTYAIVLFTLRYFQRLSKSLRLYPASRALCRSGIAGEIDKFNYRP